MSRQRAKSPRKRSVKKKESAAQGILGSMNLTAYGHGDDDAETAETGVWFSWPSFGPAAQLRIASIGCQRYADLMREARRTFGQIRRDGSWKLENDDLRRLVPAVYAQSIFTGLEEVPLGRCCDTPGYSLVRAANSLLLTLKDAGRVFHFEALAGDERPENYLADTEQNRHRLMLAFQPELENDLYQVAMKRSNFEVEVA